MPWTSCRSRWCSSRTSAWPSLRSSFPPVQALPCPTCLLPALRDQLVGLDADDLASHRIRHFVAHGTNRFDASFERGLVGVEGHRYQLSGRPVGQEVDCGEPLQALERGNDLLVDDLDCVVDLYCVTFDRADSRLHSHGLLLSSSWPNTS